MLNNSDYAGCRRVFQFLSERFFTKNCFDIFQKARINISQDNFLQVRLLKSYAAYIPKDLSEDQVYLHLRSIGYFDFIEKQGLNIKYRGILITPAVIIIEFNIQKIDPSKIYGLLQLYNLKDE